MDFVFVTGNGFDLDHGFPSSYKNFLNFVEKFIFFYSNKDISYPGFDRIEGEERLKRNLSEISLMYKDIIAIIKGSKGKEKEFLEEFYECVHYNAWIGYFQQCMKKRKKLGEEYNWVDIEEEISRAIKMITNHKREYGTIRFEATDELKLQSDGESDWSDLLSNVINGIKTYEPPKTMEHIPSATSSVRLAKEEELYKIWIKAKRILLDDYKKMIRALEIYLDFIVDLSKIEEKDTFKKITFDKIITFNYTNTYNKLYTDVETYFIHGAADYKRPANENNIVVGIDEFLPDDQKNKDIEFIGYRKYYQRIIKKCDFSYRKYLQDAGGVITWFFGHSMAATDRDILIHLLPLEDSKIIKSYICYHNIEAFSQQVANLVQILGQDRLNALVCGIDPRIVFINQENMVNEIEKERAAGL